jgi:hypothetical protein
MTKKKISLRSSTNPREVLDTAHAVLQRKGSLWVPQSTRTAEAHEGGRPITHNAFSFRLRLGLEVRGQDLVLHNISSGVGFAGAAGNGTAIVRIRHRLRTSTRAVKHALVEADLA